MKKNLLFVSCVAMGLLLTACGNPAGGSGGQGGGNGKEISWDAQIETKEASSGFHSDGKLKSKGDYVQYTFTAKEAFKGKLWAEVADRTDGIYSREDESGNQSVWYDFYNTTSGQERNPAWKYTVEFNEVEVDQDAQPAIKINGEDVELKKVLYEDFFAEDADNPVVPWLDLDVKAGENTLKITRSAGYSVSFKSFKIVG